MHTYTMNEYRRLRALGFQAWTALSGAKTREEWRKHEWGGLYTPDEDDELPVVRLRTEYDQECYDDSYIDTWTDQTQTSRDKARKELHERIERDGVINVIGEYWDGAEWVHADSVCGFVGDDWKDSGYDTDIMQATLDAAVAHAEARLLQGAV